MIERLSPPLRRAVSPFTGIVHTLDECLAGTADARFFRATCELRGSDALLGSPLEHLGGIGGSGSTRAEAASAAVGEALERYSATHLPQDRLVVASARDLGDVAVDPFRFALFSGTQYADDRFPFRPFTADTVVAWVEGRSLPHGEPALLPAELVFLGDAAFGPHRIGYTTSSGTACGATHDDTLVRGLCELLERDAFMITWAARLSLPLLDWTEERTFSDLDERFFACTGLTYAAVDVSVFHGLPSVVGVVRAPSGCAGALGVGAGTAATIEEAWFKALAEAFSSRAAGAKLALVDEGTFGPGGEGVTSFEDHIRYYADERRAAAAAFLDAGAERRSVASVPPLEDDILAALCERVAAAGSSAYAVDVTSPDVAELGLVVTKVVAPELCALDAAHAARFLGGSRLYEAAAALGLRDHVLEADELNAAPHPFP